MASCNCWVEYAEKLRSRMALENVAELRIPPEQVYAECGTSEPLGKFWNPGFWNPMRDGKKSWDTLPKNGIAVAYITGDDGKVAFVIFRLAESMIAV